MPNVDDRNRVRVRFLRSDSDAIPSRSGWVQDRCVVGPHDDGVVRGESQVLAESDGLVDVAKWRDKNLVLRVQ